MHDGVAALVLQELRIDDPGRAEQRQDHRQLEADAEGEDQRHDQREVLVDLRQELDLGVASPVPNCCMQTENRIRSGMAMK